MIVFKKCIISLETNLNKRTVFFLIFECLRRYLIFLVSRINFNFI